MRGDFGVEDEFEREVFTNYNYLKRRIMSAMPPHAYLRAIEQMRTMPHASPLAPTRWVIMVGGPLPNSNGRITAILVDPVSHGFGHTRLIVGAATGGLWFSIDSGATFNLIGNLLPSQSIGGLAVDWRPTPPVIYAGTGEGNLTDDCLYGVGLFESTDLGQTWINSKPSHFDDAAFTRLAIDTSAATAHLFAAVVPFTFVDDRGGSLVQVSNGADAGIWKSLDAGATWTQVGGANFGGNATSRPIRRIGAPCTPA